MSKQSNVPLSQQAHHAIQHVRLAPSWLLSQKTK